MASDVADLARGLSVSGNELSQSVNTGVGLASAADKLQALKLQNQQAQMDIADKQLSGSLSMANTYLRANDVVRKQMREQLINRAQQNGAPINGLLDAFDADPTLGRQWLIQSQQPGFDEKIRANPFLANQIAASDDVMGVINHTQEFLKTAGGEQAAQKVADVANIKADANKEVQSAKAEAAAAQADAKAAKGQSDSQNKALQFTQTALESARGNSAVQQAQKDIYAADKLKSLANQVGDLNNANPQQVKLFATEVAKMASGGVPSDHELRGLTPNGYSGKLAEIAQAFTSNPTPANQGALLKTLTDYGDALRGDAVKVVKDKYGRVLNTNRKRIGEDNYQLLHDNYISPLESSDKPAPLNSAPAAAAKNFSAAVNAARAAGQSDAVIRQKLLANGATQSQADALLGGN